MASQRKRTVGLFGGYAPSIINFRGVLVRTLVRDGHRVVAFAPPSPEWAGRIENLGATFVPIPFSRTGIDPLGDLRARYGFQSALKRFGVEALLAYTIKPVVYGIPAARDAGVEKRVALITGLGYTFGKETLTQRALGKITRQLYRNALSHATAVLFQNPDDQHLFQEQTLVTPEKAQVIAGSGVDLVEYPRASAPRTGSVRYLVIARLLADKGIREFVEAARIVHRQRREATFHIVGPSDPNPMAIRQSELNAWIAEGVVEIHPPTDDVRPHLAACDVYVLPSYREGTPRTVLEAMATGRPIITTDAPGCRETTVDGDNGFLVPIRDPEALADAMLKLASDRALRERMGRRSREIAEKKYDVHRVNEDIMRAMELLP